MALCLLGHIELPPNRSNGGFDHADIHYPTNRLYVAHTSNDALDVIDIAQDQYMESVAGLTGVAGALVSEAHGLVFTSNRGEDTVSIFAPQAEREAIKISVGMKPNGLSFDATRGNSQRGRSLRLGVAYAISRRRCTPGAHCRLGSSRAHPLDNLRPRAGSILCQYRVSCPHRRY